jgi:hypothetical protein
MGWIRKRRPAPATGIALAALVVALGGVAFAAIPDSSGTIHGCFQKISGSLRVVESASDCKASESPIAWNQQGPPGGTSDVHKIGKITVSGNGSQALFTEGPLTFTGRCQLDNVSGQPAGSDQADILVSTTQDHASFASLGNFTGDLTTTTPDDERQLTRALNTANTPDFGSTWFSATAPGGVALNGVLYMGVNVQGELDKCVFGGHYVISG